MKNVLLLLALTSLFFVVACNKDDDNNICDRSSTKHDILCCKINGEDWKPKIQGSDLVFPYELNYYNDIRRIELLVKNNTSNSILEGAIYIISNFESLDKENGILFTEDVIADNNFSNGCNTFDLDTLATNYIRVISIDTINFTMIGEFELSAINECGDTITVTDGYFDLNYIF